MFDMRCFLRNFLIGAASLSALFGRIANVDEPSADDLIREKILNYIKDKV